MVPPGPQNLRIHPARFARGQCATTRRGSTTVCLHACQRYCEPWVRTPGGSFDQLRELSSRLPGVETVQEKRRELSGPSWYPPGSGYVRVPMVALIASRGAKDQTLTAVVSMGRQTRLRNTSCPVRCSDWTCYKRSTELTVQRTSGYKQSNTQR